MINQIKETNRKFLFEIFSKCTTILLIILIFNISVGEAEITDNNPENTRHGFVGNSAISPALPGTNADPHIACFDGTYYIYPTTDGFDGWGASSFSCWSSNDLANWENEGVILDYKKDLKWANTKAWAPCIARKNGKYYFYFSAESQIGVAVSDKPTGPFKDPLGKPLVARGLYQCQVIDPMVFVDDDGSAYLYFGQGNCNVVKLNDDMISYDPARVKRITPKGYNEGAFVIKRNGIYYLMWSSFDTRDPRYCVNYATGTSPMGPFTSGENSTVLKQKGIVKGAGHHSVVQVPGKDMWYIAYHRFRIPDGNGYNREVCISPMKFDSGGAIENVDVFEPAYAYFMIYFGPDQKLFYAYSYDARNWKDFNDGKPVWSPPFVRDPFVNRVNGKFHLVHTTGWTGTTIGHWESDDLIKWTGGNIAVIDQEKQKCWAPEFFYSKKENLFYVYWASLHKGKYHAINYLKTSDWKNIKPSDSKVYYDIGIDDIDLTIVEYGDKYYGFHKSGQVKDKMGNRLSIVNSLDPSIDSFANDGHGKIVFSDEIKPTEGPEVIKLAGQDKWYVYGDPFNSPLQAWQTADFVKFDKIKVSTPKGAKHCSMIPISYDELQTLLGKYPSQDEKKTSELSAKKTDMLTKTSMDVATNIHVYVDQPVAKLSPNLYGLFFEDINFAADGGLYAELVQNRSFEYFYLDGREGLSDKSSDRYNPMFAWEKVEKGEGKCRVKVEKSFPLNRNNFNYLVVYVDNPGDGVGIANLGYDGIRIDQGESYDVSLYASHLDDRMNEPVIVALEGNDGEIYGSMKIDHLSDDWKKYSGVIKVNKSDDDARLTVTTKDKGRLFLDVVSLFPQKTFKGRKNGLRPDLAQALADLKPKFFRFPGGCIAHGCGLQNAYRWKDTVGDIAQRRPNWNRWGYHQTYGLGYYEYFLLCEDIGATPLPVLPVGVSCGFNRPFQVVPMDQLQEWIDDCTDLIEFANGPINSKWGKLRAQMGHPEPFGLEYICLGNEEHDTKECRERFPHFVKAIGKAYPEIKIIGTSGLGQGIPLYDQMKELGVYSSDEHYYNSPEWYIQNQNRFDDFDRNGPLVFVGEYASQGNELFNAISEAAYLTGIERNADIVDMACYAPLFAHVNHTQWRAANMIWFDKRNLVKTPNYYVQQMFSCNKGDVYLKNKVENVFAKKMPTVQGGVGIGTWNTAIVIEQVKVNNLAVEPKKWKVLQGNFQYKDKQYLQLDFDKEPALSISPNAFNDQIVTYELRARKTKGNEGFLVVFGYENSDNYYWWNIGGWNNTQHAIEISRDGMKTILDQTGGRVQDNVWYDIKIELSPGHIRCYLNNKLVHDYHESGPQISVSTTRDDSTNEIVLKLVNPTEQDVDAKVLLDGISAVAPSAKISLLTGSRKGINSINYPDTIAPVNKTIGVDKQFDYCIPAMSVQVIRIKMNE
ncbi:MAG: family 43 glycosylhydrolase [Phycisphaerae bacterium]|nr:family 43 glycosylhydrolase [Phycisphaerae bacterium]